MALESLALHDATRTFLGAYVANPKHSLLLAGPVGSGLNTIAHALAHDITSHPSNILMVEPDEKGTITIERVRLLYVETRAIRSERLVIIVDNADAMSHDAQNAFLKLLEEPVKNVHFILTAHEPSTLLTTIISRVQRIDVSKISTVASESLLRAHHVTQATVLQQMLFIAQGLPAELIRLADNSQYFEDKSSLVRLARDFLTATQHERLVLVSRISKREDALSFISTLASVLQFTSKRDPETVKSTPVETLETVASRLAANGHVRTQLMYLALNVV